MAKRTPNFTAFEMEVLTSLVNDNKEIVDCKKTNAVYNAKKQKTWDQIAEQFSAIPGCSKRTAGQLHFKFKNMKKNAMKRKSGDKVIVYGGTGGGPGKLKSTEIDHQLSSIGILIEPTDNSLDCDAEYERRLKALTHEVAGPSNSAATNDEAIPPSADSFLESFEVHLMSEEDFLKESPSNPASMPEGKTAAPVQKIPLTVKPGLKPLVVETPTTSRKNGEKIPLQKGGKRRPNLSEKAVETLVDAAEGRKAATLEEVKIKQEESKLRMQWEKTEHELRVKVALAKLKAEEERAEAESARRFYYEVMARKHMEDEME